MRLVRHWGRIGAMQGRELAQDFPTEEAGAALEQLALAKRRRGYRDLWRDGGGLVLLPPFW